MSCKADSHVAPPCTPMTKDSCHWSATAKRRRRNWSCRRSSVAVSSEATGEHPAREAGGGGRLAASVQEVGLDRSEEPGSVETSWRPVRPIPVEDDFFENVWREYRKDGNVR